MSRLRISAGAFALAALTAGSEALAAQARPDLTVTEIAIVGGAWAGRCNTVRATIRNSQRTGVSAPVYVRLRDYMLDGGVPDRTEILRNGIGPGASLPVTFRNVAVGGVMQIVTVDPQNSIAESREDNNVREYDDYTYDRPPCHTFDVNDTKAEEGKQLIFQIQRSGSLVQVQVPFRITPLPPTVRTLGSGPGTPVAGVCNRLVKNVLPDYQVGGKTVFFRTGQRTARVGVQLCSDKESDAGERVRLELLTAGGSVYPHGRTTAIGTILEPGRLR